jgi:hypothetical protein
MFRNLGQSNHVQIGQMAVLYGGPQADIASSLKREHQPYTARGSGSSNGPRWVARDRSVPLHQIEPF